MNLFKFIIILLLTLASTVITYAEITLDRNQFFQFQSDGYIVVKNLISPKEMKILKKYERSQIKNIGKDFFGYGKISFNGHQEDTRLKEITTDSNFARIAKQLVRHKDVRVLQDVFFAHTPGNNTVGWYVDDERVWPSPEFFTPLNI